MNFIKSILTLRGIASLSVCIYHLVLGNVLFFDSESIIERISKYGYLGVEIFFIISGFIIPYTMYINRYMFVNLYNFIVRRYIRVEIPYVISILIVLILNYMASNSLLFRGNKVEFDGLQFIIYVFYLTDVFNYSWYQPIYYTLKIEFQFYILIALVFSLITTKVNSLRLFLFLLLIISSTFIEIDLLKYISLFILGIIAFLYKTEMLSSRNFIFYLLAILGYFFWVYYLEVAIVSLFSVLFILFMNKEVKILGFFGKISFSLYLIHIPIGSKVINFGLRYTTEQYEKYLLLIFSLFISIVIAYFFYLSIERPSLFLSKKIKYIS